MKYFIKNIVLFLSTLILFSCCLICIYFLIYNLTFNDCPPPNISDSYSYNDKILFLRSKRAEVVAIGSSITYMLHSETVVKRTKNNSYLNLSSWGLSIKDIYFLLKTYSQVNKIRTCIVSSNLIDFIQEEKKVDYNGLKEYLQGTDPGIFKFHLKYYNTRYYLKNFRYAKKVKRRNDINECLMYDRYGGVIIDFDKLKFDSKRWVDPRYNYIKNIQYSYLDSISLFCKKNEIELLFFEAPYRAGMYSDRKVSLDTSKIRAHVIRLMNILKREAHVFINSNERIWPDSLFVDAIHFNNKGAKLYTEYCFDQTEKYKTK